MLQREDIHEEHRILTCRIVQLARESLSGGIIQIYIESTTLVSARL